MDVPAAACSLDFAGLFEFFRANGVFDRPELGAAALKVMAVYAWRRSAEVGEESMLDIGSISTADAGKVTDIIIAQGPQLDSDPAVVCNGLLEIYQSRVRHIIVKIPA